ncbi:arginase family protein [Shewanella sp. 202IG2-18]|uniref:arginase family protein n=1 Tax=Parashewanella hymeniacidonis TaxID=2807618 RepID=UPI00196127B6|nr:arginase family protein [Parashewanella hymeniacidonis]MBM7074392.1 arginase family protein [Parashewanella hymeniacidonis]
MTDSLQSLITKLENCLCPAGNGVFTVNTAKERKQALHLALFGDDDASIVDKNWKSSLLQLSSDNKKAVVMGIASDCGGGILRGANWGPLFLRNTLLNQHNSLGYFDLGDVRVIPHLLHDKYLNDPTIENCRKALYQDPQSSYPISPLSITEDVLHDFYAEFPTKGIFGIGGDHSNSYPLTKAYLQAKKKQGKRVAIIHFDAHTDLLVERLGIDLCFGSWCTHILEDLNDNSHLVQIGIRSSGKPKSHWEDTFGVRQHWAHEVIKNGAAKTVETILAHLKDEKIDELYVSFDIDAIDSEFASATGTPEPDGLTPEQAKQIIATLSEFYPITGADMMEIAPFTDASGRGASSSEETLKVGGDISAMLIEAISK